MKKGDVKAEQQYLDNRHTVLLNNFNYNSLTTKEDSIHFKTLHGHLSLIHKYFVWYVCD